MNEIFENNKLATRASNFYSLYRVPIIAIVIILLVSIVLYLSLVQLSKSNNEKAAEIYNKWTIQEIETENGQKTSRDLFNELLISSKAFIYCDIKFIIYLYIFLFYYIDIL